MKKMNQITGKYDVLPIENIDTDQIIPARFLKATTREGFGKHLFADWRYNKDGSLNNDFALNKVEAGAQILVAGKNFGCGSSREHAAWAVEDYGYRVVVSSFFADIFRNNALNNGVLPITVSEAFLKGLMEAQAATGSNTVEVDLPAQTLTNKATGECFTFEIGGYKKECLVQGYDDIDYLLARKELIEQFEQKG